MEDGPQTCTIGPLPFQKQRVEVASGHTPSKVPDMAIIKEAGEGEGEGEGEEEKELISVGGGKRSCKRMGGEGSPLPTELRKEGVRRRVKLSRG